MNVLIVGASGATGRLLVEQLLDRGQAVKAMVRAPERLPEGLKGRAGLSVIVASVLDLTDAEMQEHVQGCDAVASCLGHNLTLKGLFGRPRRLVTDATRRLCDAIKAAGPEKPVKFVLMNTAGNANRDLDEPRSLGEKCAVGLLRLLVPPHSDNEAAAEYLRTQIPRDDRDIEWTAVRPDSLIDEPEATEYDLHPSPIRSPLFNPGRTSRINVAHFMAELIMNDALWDQLEEDGCRWFIMDCRGRVGRPPQRERVSIGCCALKK